MSLHAETQKRRILGRVAKYMFPSGVWYVDPADEKITHKPQIAWDHEWVSTANEQRQSDKHCGLLKTVLFECFGFHPQYCKNVCWKLVLNPKTFHDLWKLYQIQIKLNFEAKCGPEFRPYIDHLYGGYFYCYSKEEGDQKAREVQKQVNKHFREPVEVKLKRGCTEMEDRFGLSSTWKPTPKELIKAEKHYASFFNFPSEAIPYPEWIKPEIINKWFDFARDNNDVTVKEYGIKYVGSDIEIDYY